MSITYPTSLDDFTNPVSTDTTTTVDHASQHSNINDAVEALEAKVGVNSSAVTTSHDYKLSKVTGSNKAVSTGWLLSVVKASDQTITASTVLTADNELTFNAGASETWIIDISIPFTSPTAAGLRVSLNGPSGSTGKFSIIDTVTGNTNTANTSIGTAAVVVNTGATSELVVLKGVVTTSSTPGAIYLSWAQGTSNAGDSIVRAYAYLTALRNS